MKYMFQAKFSHSSKVPTGARLMTQKFDACKKEKCRPSSFQGTKQRSHGTRRRQILFCSWLMDWLGSLYGLSMESVLGMAVCERSCMCSAAQNTPVQIHYMLGMRLAVVALVCFSKVRLHDETRAASAWQSLNMTMKDARKEKCQRHMCQMFFPWSFGPASSKAMTWNHLHQSIATWYLHSYTVHTKYINISCKVE